MDNRKDNIKEILEKAGEKYEAAEVTETKSQEGLEFEFHSESVGGFVFERVDSITLPPKEEETAPEPEKPREPVEEFSIPETFSVDSTYDTPIKEEEPPRIWTTYIPRFTEVSDNYRMARTMRAAPEVKRRDSGETAPKIDPLAEIDENVETESSVVVNSAKKQDLPGESMSVYKFKTDDGEEPTEEHEAETEATAEPEASECAAFNAEPVEPASEANRESAPEYTPERVERTAKKQGLSNYYSVPLEAESNEPEEDPDLESYDGKLKNGEYTSFVRRDNFKDKFLDSLISVKVRFFVALVLSLLVAAFENLGIFGVNIAEAFSLANIPWAIPLIDMQFVICLLALAIPEVVSGIKALAGGRVTPAVFLPISAILYAVYCAVLMSNTPAVYPMFAFVFSISALMAIGSSYFGSSSDFTAFKRASRNCEKKIIDNKYTRTLERENIALDGLVEEHKSKTARVFRTLFASDFFARTTKTVNNRFNMTVGFIIGIGAAAVTAVIAYFVPGGTVAAMSALALVPMLAFPAASYIAILLPYFHAQKEASNENSAFIGASSLDEYAGVDVVTFDDTEAFGPEDVSLKQVMLYGSADNISKPLRQMAALFHVAGGPLDLLFSNSLDKHCPPASHTVIEPDGISGYVEGAEVLAGSREYMVRHGVYIPDEPQGSGGAQHSTRTMYAAEAGRVYAKFSIRYSFSEGFTMLLPVLREEGIIPLIYTRDPNINNELVTTLTAGADAIRVMKKTSAASGDSKIYRRASAGIVTDGDKNNAINMILLVKKSLKLRSRIATLELTVMSVSAALAVLLSLFGMSAISSLITGGWQLVWCAALYLMSRSTYSIRKNKKEKDNEAE